MSFSKVHSAQTYLLKAHIIDIETDLSRGLYSFSIVGLPSQAVEESRDRVSAALKNSGFESPKSKNQKVIIALAPADIKKEGPAFDVGIALGYLLADEEIDFDPAGKLFLGELSLDGSVRSIIGSLPLVVEAKRKGFKEVYVPMENVLEAALVDGIKIFGVSNLFDLVAHLDANILKGENFKKRKENALVPAQKTEIIIENTENDLDIDDIEGQESAKRGLLIAAAGGHNVAMFGPPGTGKTMLAKAYRSILPPLSFDETMEVTAIHSVSGNLSGPYLAIPPFRSPHHTASYVSLVGGGATPKPGEITLAHKGVLFLDEFPEFDRRVLETLRQPLEERVISVSRAKGSANFPAHFTLIAAMNPCPCGNFGIDGKTCVCTPMAIGRYQRKISGPIIDRIDMWLEVSKVDHDKILKKKIRGNETSKTKDMVALARKIQEKRFHRHPRGIKLNSEMNARDIPIYINLSKEAEDILSTSAKSLDLSARACHRIMKLSRTLADIAGLEEISRDNMLEAIRYRPKKQEII